MNQMEIIICEGKTEYNYIKELTAFVQHSLPCSENNLPRIRYNPRPHPDSGAPKNKSVFGVGTGRYQWVVKAFGKEQKNNPKCCFKILVDMDLYQRNDKDCRTLYRDGIKGQKHPGFSFALMNFEDFLALHFDDQVFDEWFTKMNDANHFAHPLHSEEYMKIYNQVFPEYAKGRLPDEFITVKSLQNMIRHSVKVETVACPLLRISNIQVFHRELINDLQSAYPEYFSVGL